MRVQAYTLFSGTVTITVASARVEAAPSHVFQFAKLHEDIAARTRALLLEHRQCGESALAWPAERRLSHYFPAVEGAPIYRLAELVPAGTARDVDADYQLEIIRLRFGFALNLLPAAYLASDEIGQAIERHVEQAVKSALAAAGIASSVSAPGDETIRPGDTTEIDCTVELGAAAARTGLEVPAGNGQ